MSNNNPSGINGYGVKEYPPDEILSPALLQYAHERLSIQERLNRLSKEFDLHIKKSRLAELNKKFSIPSTRKPPNKEIATQAILHEVATDVAGFMGVGSIGNSLAIQGILIPRDFIRNILTTYDKEGSLKRHPGSRRVQRTPLVAPGPNYQWHSDGHEKLNAQALGMGGVGLNIYGIKDQYSAYLLHLVVVPNNRLETTIGHVYLDCIQKHQLIPISFVMDKGSETGIVFAYQTGLRETYAPEIDSNIFPPALHLSSIHNTPIESLWGIFLKQIGLSIKQTIQEGQMNGTFHSQSELHVNLFNWLWPRIVQHQLDLFVEKWNNHRIRGQKKKLNASNSTPRHAFMCPDNPAEECGIQIDQCVIDGLRDQIEVPRDYSFRWIDDQTFEDRCRQAYENIGQPPLSQLSSGWAIFLKMADWLMA